MPLSLVTSQQFLLICDMECSQYSLQVLIEKADAEWGKCVVRGPGRSDVGLPGMQGSCDLMKSELFLLSPLTMLPESGHKLLDAHRPLL